MDYTYNNDTLSVKLLVNDKVSNVKITKSNNIVKTEYLDVQTGNNETFLLNTSYKTLYSSVTYKTVDVSNELSNFDSLTTLSYDAYKTTKVSYKTIADSVGTGTNSS